MWFNQKPKFLDCLILSVVTLFVTAQPFFLHHEIIMLDTGNHLPSINALLHGEVLYKDFLYWRGPIDLYLPALMMKLWGIETALLSVYFYAGTILTLMAGIFVAKEIYQTRLILYLMAPVFIARTFPRVSYYYWGGFRYFIGFVALYCAIQGFKKQKLSWVLASGIMCGICWLTTIEAGVSTILAIALAMAISFALKIFSRDFWKKSFAYFVLGNFFVFIPYIIYLFFTQSLAAYVDITLTVPKFLTTLMDSRGQYPETFWLFLYSLIPGTQFFKFMTPFYLYIFLFVCLCYRIRERKYDWEIPSVITLAVYGLILFFASFRFIEGHHFEMALQPEKILLFFLIEKGYLALRERKFFWPVYVFRFLVGGLVLSSLGYSIQRYNHRFPIIKIIRKFVSKKSIEELSPLYGQETRTLNIERVKHMTVPRWQADEIEGVVAFLKKNTRPDEAIFCFPEVGNFAFWADRPFIGRFAIGTSAWVDERWHQELVDDFKRGSPKYVIMTHVGHRTFPAAIYFRYPKNIRKYKEITKLILDNYTPVKSFESVAIYERKRDE